MTASLHTALRADRPQPTSGSASNAEALFRFAIEEHRGIFVKTARAFAEGDADQQDLLQEILLSVWQAIPSYNDGCKLSTFLYRVAHNRALNWKRSRARYERKLQHLASLPPLVAADEGEVRERQLNWLYRAIHRLPPADRTLILLQLDRLSLREIADITGLSETNVGVRLHRIKQTLLTQRHEESTDL